MTALHDLAELAGAMVLGSPEGAHYLFTAEQLAELVRLVDPGAADLARLHDALEKSGKTVRIIVDSPS